MATNEPSNGTSNGNGNDAPPGPPGNSLVRDLTAGLVVFLVALPLCLGIALASTPAGEPPRLLSGLIAGIVGGLVVGLLSGSHTSVSGPAAGLTAVVAAQIAALGSFQTFLLAVVLAGAIQIGLGVARAGVLAAFIPSSVIKGLLAAIGVILILKQIPHALGHDADPMGEMAFLQPDNENTFSELANWHDVSHGAAVIGLLSVAVLMLWDRSKALKKSPVPSALVVVVLGVVLAEAFRGLNGLWEVTAGHLVQVPVATTVEGFFAQLAAPDFSQLSVPKVYLAAFTIAAVASLETLLNLEAVDKLDPKQRTSPPSRELIAQGAGNVASGLLGGLPVTSVIVRSSVNLNAGAQTKWSAVFHGLLLLVAVALLPTYLNKIPLSCLAAILLVTGFKLASPKLIRDMWGQGKAQFLPFAVTVVAIVLTDLLVGVVIGLAVATAFILWSNVKRPIRVIRENHLGGEVTHIELANQVSFLNRAALVAVLDAVPPGGHVLLDASQTDYIDPDILALLRDYIAHTGPVRGVKVSSRGFRDKYQVDERIQYADYSSRELQEAVTPAQVLQILKDGNERFRTGQRLTRDLGRMVEATAAGQHPLAAVLSCIDSRSPAELIFDLGVGDIFVSRVAGNVTSRKILGSLEYACAVAGAKVVVVVGHTRCGAVGAAVNLACSGETAAAATGCQHLDFIVTEVQKSLDEPTCRAAVHTPPAERGKLADEVARRNVIQTVANMTSQSETLAKLVKDGRIMVVGAMYDVATGAIEFLPPHNA